ncbi:hypothetical protein [Aureimonas sp. SA4125]|uniref:hypothetical protein n=1 Tax=Aureimonas sp. SA4125 TaxID=2826993 RepID=UPI001CC6BC18|nr:hypothetical protein [Aureimonas sp. SA4125]
MTKMHLPPPTETRSQDGLALPTRLFAILFLFAAAYAVACAAAGVSIARPVLEMISLLQN